LRSPKENRGEADDTDAVGVHAVRDDTSAVMTVVVIVTGSEDTADITIMTSGTETAIIAAATGTGLGHLPDQVPGTTIAKRDGQLRGLGVVMVARMKKLDPIGLRVATHVGSSVATRRGIADVILSDVRIVMTLTDDTDVRRYDNEIILSKGKGLIRLQRVAHLLMHMTKSSV